MASRRPTPSEAEPVGKDAERRVAELTRALAAAREREADFRQAAFDLNAELLHKDAELAALKERLDVADAQAAEAAVLGSRVSELEGLTKTRAFRFATVWWRVKAAILRR